MDCGITCTFVSPGSLDVCACVSTLPPSGTFSCDPGSGFLCRTLQLHECFPSVNNLGKLPRSFPV